MQWLNPNPPRESLVVDVGPALTGKVEISITILPWFRNKRLKKFNNNDEVRDAILASACIAGLPMHLPGYGWAMDGAFSDFQIIKVQCCTLCGT